MKTSTVLEPELSSFSKALDENNQGTWPLSVSVVEMNAKSFLSLFAVLLFAGCVGQMDDINSTGESDSPTKPGNTGKPGTSGKPGSSGNPETPGDSETPDSPLIPGLPDDPDDPNGPSIPSEPDDEMIPADPIPDGNQACIPTERLFMRKAWAQVAQPTCSACHNGQGLAAMSDFILNREIGFGDQSDHNLETMKRMATLRHTDLNNQSHLLLKATGTVAHGGGRAIAPNSHEFNVLKQFVDRVENPIDCSSGETDGSFFDGIVNHEAPDLFRKAAVGLAGRLPTDEEIATIARDGEPALDKALDKILGEDLFFERLKDGFNDIFLTDYYLGDTPENRLAPAHFPNAYWWDRLGLSGVPLHQLRTKGRYGIAREPLELIAYIVKNNRPITQILTADFTMVSPFSAKNYGVFDKVRFNNPENQYEFQPVKLPAIAAGGGQGSDFPHAGILTSYMILSRYPSTETNRNRARSSFFYSKFLAIDLLELAARSNTPLETVLQYDNPTRDAPACAICHVVMDPVAGAFQNHDDRGWYRPRSGGWYKDTFSPGVNGKLLPEGQGWQGLRWLGQETVKDPRFALAMVEHVFFIVTGQKPLGLPRSFESADYEAKLTAYATQREFLREASEKLIAANYNLKNAFKTVILSPYYSAKTTTDGQLSPQRANELSEIGLARPLHPEQLHRKIIAIFGSPWKSGYRDAFDQYVYKYVYGGIDSDQLVERLNEANGVMAGVASLMANEVSCTNTAKDFDRPRDQRKLFPHVDPADQPGSNADTDNRIKQTIQYLHNRLLGQRLDIKDAEIQHSFDLFKDVVASGRSEVQQDGSKAKIFAPCATSKLANDPNYTVRGWMAVVSYMLSTYDFLYE